MAEIIRIDLKIYTPLQLSVFSTLILIPINKMAHI